FFKAEDGRRDWSVTGVQTCALPISALNLPQRPGEVARAQDLAQGEVGGAGALVGRGAAEQAERRRVRRGRGPEPALAGVDPVELLDQAALERAAPGRRARAARLRL